MRNEAAVRQFADPDDDVKPLLDRVDDPVVQGEVDLHIRVTGQIAGDHP